MSETLTQEEARLRAMVDALQRLVRELKFEFEGNLMVEVVDDTPESWGRLMDEAEILGEWDPDDRNPEDGYEVLFTDCDRCGRLVIPVLGGTAALDQCRWCDR
jgi:hypothetical protein